MAVDRDRAGVAAVDVEYAQGSRALLVPHQCLRCQAPLVALRTAMQCAACGAEWPIVNGVPFYSSANYFGEVSQPEMRTLIQVALQSN